MSRLHMMMFNLSLHVADAGRNLWGRAAARAREQRGDVPGWVMITLMSALLVAALLAIAGPRLQDLFNQAIDRVSGLG